MKRALAIAGRMALSLLGGIAVYLLLYGGTGWLADLVGYDNPVGRAVGFVNGALSWLGWGPIFIVLFCIALFVVLTKAQVLGPVQRTGDKPILKG